MAMLAVPISQDISRLFQQIDVEAERDQSDHITVIYFGDNMPIKQISKLLPPMFGLTSEMKPIEAEIQKITCFPEGKHGFPVIAEIKSQGLQDFRKNILKILDNNKIKYEDAYPEYRPHITLGYAKEKIKDTKIDKFKFSISEVKLYGGDSHDERVSVN